MLRNCTRIWFCLAVWFINNLTAAPLQGQTFDLGVFKIGVDTENGFALHKEINIDTPFFKVRKTSEIGFGDPMLTDSDSNSDEISEEEQSSRQKRQAIDDKSTHNGTLQRKKRSPCYGGTRYPTQNTGGGGQEEARRRRSIAQKVNKLKAKSKGGSKKSKGLGRRRRRRAAEIESFYNEVQMQNNLGGHVDQALQRIQSLMVLTMQSAKQFIETAKNRF